MPFHKIGFVLALLLNSPAAAESLRYVIKWPSGLSLGEATLTSSLTERGFTYTFDVDASLPAYAIRDRYTSVASPTRCTISFERQTEHGSRKTDERITVNPEGKITRQTIGGGTTEISPFPCPRDALALLASARMSLQQNAVPAAQTVLFGAGYPVRFENSGAETISISEKPVAADKITCVLTLPKTGDYRIALFFLRDSTRTPALIKAPFALGTFSLELVR